MKCKYCQAELEENVTVCPACGKELEEIPVQETAEAEISNPVETVEAEPEAPRIKEGIKATPGKIALAIVAGLVVLALLIAMVISGVDGDLLGGTEETVAPTSTAVGTENAEAATEGTIPPDGNPENVTCKGSYSVTTEELNASRDTVVAIVGDEELTIGELQIYYWESIYAFDSNYGATATGIDLSLGLDTQLCAIGDIAVTWQQYFLDYALNVWHQHQAVTLAGRDHGYELTADYQAELDSLPDQIEAMAAYYGMESGEVWLEAYIGPGCIPADFITYMSTYYHGAGYLEEMEQNTAFTAEEVEAYFDENEALYADSGITRESGKYYDVRHILITIESASEADDGAYSDEDWAACMAQAQQILDDWKAGEATEDSFAALAMEKSEDGGSNYNGGLYSYLTADTNFVENFKAWYLDESRQVGDTGLVQSDYGYHIMYFSGSQDMYYAYAEADMISDVIAAAVPAAMEKYPMTVDYSAIKLGYINLVNG